MMTLPRPGCAIGDDPQGVLYALRVPSRHRRDVDFYLQKAGGVLIVEGPPETGKTTLVRAVLPEVDDRYIVWLNQQKPADQSRANQIVARPRDVRHLVLDDVHELSPGALDDLERDLERQVNSPGNKLHVTLIGHPMTAWKEVVMRVTNPGVVVMRPETDDSVRALLEKYQEATNLRFAQLDAMVAEARGSFRLAQAICTNLIEFSGINEIKESPQTVPWRPEELRFAMRKALSRALRETLLAWTTLGSTEPVARACVAVLREFASSGKPAVDLRALRQTHAHLSRGFDWLETNMSRLLGERKEMAGTFSYARTLKCHDPQMMYFLSLLDLRVPDSESSPKRAPRDDDDTLDWAAIEAAAGKTGARKRPNGKTFAPPAPNADLKSIFEWEPEYPWWDEKAQKLHTILAQACRDLGNANALVEKAGVKAGRISFDDSPETVWRSILNAASSQGKLRRLLELARKDPYIEAYWPLIDECVAPAKLL